jgi:septum site-determining protein MinC
LSKSKLVALVLELQAQTRPVPDTKDAPTTVVPAAETEPPCSPVNVAQQTSLVINSSVRSGQVVEFPHGDVTVIGSVGSGAEIIAGGSIHIYGSLRGRAIAGTSGDRSARIFCQNFQPELLCISGGYRAAENLDPSLRGRPIQASLDGLLMVFAALG